MLTSKYIKVEIKNRLAVLTLCQKEKKNAINKEMYEDITRCLESLSNNNDVSITAITGSGDFYSSGTDLLDGMGEDLISNYENLKKVSQRLKRFLEAFINHKKILIAVVNGPAIGIAVTTLALCDIVYSVDTATFQTPFTKLGMSVEGCSSYTFPLIMGSAKANDMLLFNRKLTAREAYEWGLVSNLFTKKEMETTLWPELERKALELPFKSLKYSKTMIRGFHLAKLHEANRQEILRLEERWRSEDCMNAVLSFMNRRSKM